MSARVVCISRDVGAGGEEIGRMVAGELAFAYVDEEIVSGAAEKLGVSPDLVADVERRRPLVRRLIEEVLVDTAHASMLSGLALPELPDRRHSEDYRALIEQAIRETAERGDVVIVAHAASIALGASPGVLRVLVTGSEPVRVERLVENAGLEAEEARRLVAEGDRARADYLKRFYGVKDELPTHYDLVVNTDVLGADAAARVLLGAARP